MMLVKVMVMKMCHSVAESYVIVDNDFDKSYGGSDCGVTVLVKDMVMEIVDHDVGGSYGNENVCHSVGESHGDGDCG